MQNIATGISLLVYGLGLSLAMAAQNEVVLDLEPTRENPRNSEGAFVTLQSGRILFIYTQFYGGADDESPARIVSIVSDDGGRTWSGKSQVVVENEGGDNVMSVSVLRLKSGKLALFYLRKNNWMDCQPQIRFSTDEAATWSVPQRALLAPGYFVLNNDRVIQMENGRLIMPLAFHRAKGGDPKSSRSFDYRALSLWFWSDDEGKTWRESDSWWGPPLPSRAGLQEPGVVELADASLWSWMRTDLGCLYASTSSDRGQTWTPPQATPLKSPVSPASIKRIPGTPHLLALFNDHTGDVPFTAGKRTPLVAAISRDGGKTWTDKQAVEADPNSGYCYTAIHFTADAVLLAYCAGEYREGLLNRLRIRRISRDWFAN